MAKVINEQLCKAPPICFIYNSRHRLTTAPKSFESEELASSADVRQRAAAGALLIGVRTLGIRGLGLVGNLVLARLLTPADFGVVAVGYVVMSAAVTLTDGGLGAALIRGSHAPSRPELGAVTGFQLLGCLLVLAVTGVVTTMIGGRAFITLIIVASLPILTLQTPAAIVLERDLLFRPAIISDLSQAVCYTTVSIGSVTIFGLGPWGLAIATLASSIVGTIVISVLAPLRFVVPRLDFKRIRSILRFGVQFQALNATGLIRDQVLNTLTGVLAGISTLGLWSLSYRLLQPGMLVFQTLRRVSYPGMARLRDLDENPREIVVRSLSMTCVAASFVLAPLAASAHALIPSLFGARWGPCANTVTMAAWSMLPSGALSVAAAGYLLAWGYAAEGLNIVAAHTIGGLCVAAALLPVIGINALGVAYITMAAIDVVFFSHYLASHLPDFSPSRAILVPTLVSTIATAAGWVTTETLGLGLVAAVCGALVALLGVAVGHWLTDRATVRRLWRTARVATARHTSDARGADRKPVPGIAPVVD